MLVQCHMQREILVAAHDFERQRVSDLGTKQAVRKLADIADRSALDGDNDIVGLKSRSQRRSFGLHILDEDAVMTGKAQCARDGGGHGAHHHAYFAAPHPPVLL